jgi:hypothetical protein
MRLSRSISPGAQQLEWLLHAKYAPTVSLNTYVLLVPRDKIISRFGERFLALRIAPGAIRVGTGCAARSIGTAKYRARPFIGRALPPRSGARGEGISSDFVRFVVHV